MVKVIVVDNLADKEMYPINSKADELMLRNEYTKTITINGIEYERIPQPPKPTGRKSTIMQLMAAGFIITNSYGNSSPTKRLPVSDIESEFELIQKKESKLSRTERDRVEVAFLRIYKPVIK